MHDGQVYLQVYSLFCFQWSFMTPFPNFQMFSNCFSYFLCLESLFMTGNFHPENIGLQETLGDHRRRQARRFPKVYLSPQIFFCVPKHRVEESLLEEMCRELWSILYSSGKKVKPYRPKTRNLSTQGSKFSHFVTST